MRRLLVLLLVGCATPQGSPTDTPQPNAEKAAPAPAPATLPVEFEVVGDPIVEPSYLPPMATWRALMSRLTTLRADAGQGREDILVTFEKNALHATTRKGRRTTWQLPDGLVFQGVPMHLLLRSDATLALIDQTGTEVPLGQEVTVVRALVLGAGGTREFRLVIKGGATFRSISNAG